MYSWSVDKIVILSLLLNALPCQSLKQTDCAKPPNSLLQLLNHFTGHGKEDICCLDKQWESIGFIDYGAALNVPDATSYFHYNGTGKIAFDAVGKKSYIQFKINAFSPQIPIYSEFTTTTIKDFNVGIMYNIDDEGHCTRESIPTDMQSFCIPGDALNISKGVIEKDFISTYQFSKSFTGAKQILTASVLLRDKSCIPVRVSQSVIYPKDVTHGTLLNLDVMDIRIGIRDPSIFVQPKSCNNI